MHANRLYVSSQEIVDRVVSVNLQLVAVVLLLHVVCLHYRYHVIKLHLVDNVVEVLESEQIT